MTKDSYREQIFELLDNEMVQEGFSMISTGVSVGKPEFGAVMQVFSSFGRLADEIKLQRIISGLSSGLNQETYTNELKSYIRLSEEHAANVANTIRKALLADSEAVCVLLGRILADHIRVKEKYDRQDVIIIHALENTTDEDLFEFRDMLKEVKDDQIEIKDRFTECIDWGLSNRLFKNDSGYRVEGENAEYYDCIKVNDSAYKLSEYMEEVKQLFRK